MIDQETHTLTQRHYWADTGDLNGPITRSVQPGSAEEARQDWIRRLRVMKTPFCCDGRVVSYVRHYDFGRDSFDVRIELEWSDDAQPALFADTDGGR